MFSKDDAGETRAQLIVFLGTVIRPYRVCGGIVDQLLTISWKLQESDLLVDQYTAKRSEARFRAFRFGATGPTRRNQADTKVGIRARYLERCGSTPTYQEVNPSNRRNSGRHMRSFLSAIQAASSRSGLIRIAERHRSEPIARDTSVFAHDAQAAGTMTPESQHPVTHALTGGARTAAAPASGRRQGLIGQLIGRRDELERIHAAVQQATSGHGAIVIVEGEPGIGKTALLVAAARHASVEGMTVLRGAAKELGHRVSFAASASLLPTAWNQSDTIGPADADITSVAIGREIAQIESFITGFTDLCTAAPLMLIMDDAHWVDPSSLLMLQRLGEYASELPILILIALRPLPREGDLSSLLSQFEAWGAEHLRLGPMNATDVVTLVETSFGSAAGPRLSDIVAGAGGNPLYIIELVTGLMQAGMIELGEIKPDPDTQPTWRPTPIQLPEPLTDVIVRRLDFLSPRSRQILPMAASLGTDVEAIELSSVLGAALIDVWDVISASVEAGILVRSGSDLVFRHDLIRQVLAEQLPPSTRITLQLRAARVLMSMDAPVERIAAYLLAGDTPLDTAILDWLIDVAERLTARAPGLAVSLISRAVRTPGLDSSRSDTLRLWQVRALLWNGSPMEAEAAARETLSEVVTSADRDPAVESPLQWLLAHACLAQGKVADALAVAESVLTWSDLSPLQRGQFLGFCGLSYLFQQRFDMAERASALAISSGDALSDPVAGGLGAAGLGLLRYQQGFLNEAQDLGDQLVQDYESADRRRVPQIDPYSLSGRCHRERGDYASAEKSFTLALRLSESTSGTYLGLIRLDLAHTHYLQGRWDEALADLRALPTERDVFGYSSAAKCLAALVAVRRGTYSDDAAALPQPAELIGTRNTTHLRPWVQALVHESHGRPEQALTVLSDVVADLTDETTAATAYPLHPDLARLAAATGRHDIAERVAAAAEVLDARGHTASRRANALLCRGLAEGDVELVAESAETYRGSGQPWYEAQALENLAILLATGDRQEDALSTLEKAVELYTGLDAAWDAARAETRMRGLGIRRGRRGPRKRPKTGWDALTPTERKVAAQIAQGRSNSEIATRMFLSPRTIQSHVSSILTKLNLTSRVQVAVGLAQQTSW
ncbi:AAA family ATPase [Nocardia sp. NBC_00511]|uniref:helix-turn-helix transcriptional regulator n=1 Tax=Nocardia sp. NBC_00511 TaxID=2903591 RepID=UPI0030E4EA92